MKPYGAFRNYTGWILNCLVIQSSLHCSTGYMKWYHMSIMAPSVTKKIFLYSTVCSDQQRRYQNSTSRAIHEGNPLAIDGYMKVCMPTFWKRWIQASPYIVCNAISFPEFPMLAPWTLLSGWIQGSAVQIPLKIVKLVVSILFCHKRSLILVTLKCHHGLG